jgi:hypothetical protein
MDKLRNGIISLRHFAFTGPSGSFNMDATVYHKVNE